MNRRNFLVGSSIAALVLTSPASAWPIHGGHADDVIPVSSLTPGSFSANAFSGFTSPATTVHSLGGVNLISPNPDNDLLVATSNYVVRDSQCTCYPGEHSAILLRLSGTAGSQSCVYFIYNGTVTGGDIRVGVMTGFNAAQGFASQTAATNYTYYFNPDVATSSEGIAAGFTNSYTNGDQFTFGVQGFQVFLQWNGHDLIRYTEWRMMASGTCGIWTVNGKGSRDITIHYPAPTFLFSNPSAQVYDPRDFGMRNVAAATGSMSAGSNQITGIGAGTFQVGDQIIVCVGGEAGAGARGTKGVGGTWPALNYPNTAAMNADTSQAGGTYAYDASSSPLAAYIWGGSSWTHTQSGGGAQSYYTFYAIPLPLVAIVTAVVGTTLTVSTVALVATTNADIRLDCLPSFYVFNEGPPADRFAPNPVNLTFTIPSSQGTADQCWYLSDVVKNPNVAPAANTIIKGAGRTLTTLKSPKSCTPGAFLFTGLVSNGFSVSDMKFIGNNGASGYGFVHGTNTFTGYATAVSLNSVSSNTGFVIKNLDVVDTVGEGCAISAASPLIDNCTSTLNGEQYDYVQWQMSLDDASGGTIQNCTVTGTFLVKAYELFNTTNCSIINCGGTNILFSTNSSSNWTIDCRGLTVNYTAGSFISQLSGAITEAIFNINDNAFLSGNTGTLYLGRHIQTGYVDTAGNNSLLFIQASAAQPNLTVIGAYPGAGGCSTSLDGLLQAPDYFAGASMYGACAIFSDSINTSVTGIRIKGVAKAAVTNIHLTAGSSSVTNCVADAISAGPTLSGNQTNAAYGGC